jgi:hypothetical protein
MNLKINQFASLALAVLDALFVKFGTGHHSSLQTLPDVRATLKLAFASRLVYQFVICTTKLGICTFYLRVFQDKRSKMLIYLLLGFIIITALVIELAFIFACKPVSGAWAIPQTCASPFASFYTNTITSVMADVALMVFVIPRVRKSQQLFYSKLPSNVANTNTSTSANGSQAENYSPLRRQSRRPHHHRRLHPPRPHRQVERKQRRIM